MTHFRNPRADENTGTDNSLDATLTWRLVLAVIGVLSIGVTILSVYIPIGMRHAAIESSASAVHELLRQVMQSRIYYSETIVEKLRLDPKVEITADHYGKDNAFPLPATYAKELTGRISREGFDVQLYSPYSWKPSQTRILDAFQQRAWELLNENPNRVVQVEESQRGKRLLRVAVADQLTSQKCVDCHNSNPNSPKHDWKVGDVRGVLEVTKDIDQEIFSANNRADKIFIAIILASLLICFSLIAIARIVDDRTAEKREAHQRIQHIAQHDALTGLMNRAYFLDTVDKAIAMNGHRQGGVTVFYIDLDRFKEVNDGLGHAAGDHLLKVVAERLRHVMHDDDFISRLGGDEFTAASLKCGTPEQAQAIGNALVQSLSKPIQIGDNEVAISGSIGMLIGEPRFTTASEMLRAADIALYRAKDSGKNCAVLYSEDMDAELNKRREIEQMIRENVDNDAVEVFFQPLVLANSGVPCGFEALVRMRDRDNNLVSPAIFIPVAEEMGIINRIGIDVMRKACRTAAMWPPHITISVNLSPAQFVTLTTNSEPISKVVQRVLDETGLEPHRLELEITEGIFLDQTDDIMCELKALRDIGVHIVMDDFGTGYSSLAYLWKFPFDKLKIDQSFVRLLNEGDAKMTSFIRTMASLGHTLNMKVTAEGVETADQAAYLRVLGVDQLQGYYFGRPAPAAEFADVLFGARAGQPLGPQQAPLFALPGLGRQPTASPPPSPAVARATAGPRLQLTPSPALQPALKPAADLAPQPVLQPEAALEDIKAVLNSHLAASDERMRALQTLSPNPPAAGQPLSAAHRASNLEAFVSAAIDRYSRSTRSKI